MDPALPVVPAVPVAEASIEPPAPTGLPVLPADDPTPQPPASARQDRKANPTAASPAAVDLFGADIA
jgi:hypothetical protein